MNEEFGVTIFDMGRASFDDPFGIYAIPPIETLKDLDAYTIQGFSDRGAPFRLVHDDTGKKLTYYRPADWTDEDWDEFCNEMEEDLCGDATSDE